VQIIIIYFLHGTLKDKSYLFSFTRYHLTAIISKRIVALEDLSLDERYELIKALFVF